jgi:hypothetical protein
MQTLLDRALLGGAACEVHGLVTIARDAPPCRSVAGHPRVTAAVCGPSGQRLAEHDQVRSGLQRESDAEGDDAFLRRSRSPIVPTVARVIQSTTTARFAAMTASDRWFALALTVLAGVRLGLRAEDA